MIRLLRELRTREMPSFSLIATSFDGTQPPSRRVERARCLAMSSGYRRADSETNYLHYQGAQREGERALHEAQGR